MAWTEVRLGDGDGQPVGPGPFGAQRGDTIQPRPVGRDAGYAETAPLRGPDQTQLLLTPI
jgi:hypothetical protein